MLTDCGVCRCPRRGIPAGEPDIGPREADQADAAAAREELVEALEAGRGCAGGRSPVLRGDGEREGRPRAR